MNKLLAFWSPSHAGATTLLLNTAAALGSRFGNVVAVDLNLPTPSLALYADLLPHSDPQRTCLSRLMPAIDAGRVTPDLLARHLVQGPGFALLPGMLDVGLGSRFSEAHVRTLLTALASWFDLVLVDVTPALDSIACLPVLEMADRVGLVVGPEIASRFHTRRNLVVLRSTRLAQRLSLVLNRTGSIDPRQVAQELEIPVAASVPPLNMMNDLTDSGRIAYTVGGVLPAMTRFRAAVDQLATLMLRRDQE